MNKILYVASEAFPLIKTGGLGDVAGSLPRALQKQQQDVRLLLPAYREVLAKLKHPKVVAETTHYQQPVRILETILPGTKVKTWLVDCTAAFDRPGNPYVNAEGHDWHDNAFRFTLFCQTAVELAQNQLKLDWQPDIVHCNDWQTGLIPALLTLFPQRPATVFTIHNMAYLGMFSKQVFFDLGLPGELWFPGGVEFYDQFCFMKGGLAYADRINTVSPSYAREIQQPEFGYGLDGLLRHRSQRLNGILNGIDTDVWNPGTDEHLVHPYNRRSLAQKSLNKTALQQALGLPVGASIPLIGMVSRMVEQKGFDTLLGAMPELVKLPLQMVFLGSGNPYYQQMLTQWAQRHPDRIHVRIGYDETLSHRIEAASDMYFMPSLFEPCGLNQLYSLRYATLPIVRNVGGLADSVTDTMENTIQDHSATGFVVYDNRPESLAATVRRALEYYKQGGIWQSVQDNAMRQDFSWQHSAKDYLKLYESAITDYASLT
jgi:starch synthase